MEYSEVSQNFLDSTASIVNGKIVTKVYRKPTDSFTFLHPQSFHPPHTKSSIVYSQAIRYSKLCSEEQVRNEEIKNLHNAFQMSGYKEHDIQVNITKAMEKPRDELLKYKIKHKTDRVPMVLTFNPQLNKIKKIAKSLQHVIDDDPFTKSLFPSPPVMAYRQPPSLKKILVKSKLTPAPEPGTFKCDKARCKTCPSIYNAGKINITNTGATFEPKGNFNCGSFGVIYLITCNKCPGVHYIGETIQPLRGRMNGHRQYIREGNRDLPVVRHFSERGHTFENLSPCLYRGE